MAITLDTKKKFIEDYKKGLTITELSDKYKVVPSTAFFWIKYYKNGTLFKDNVRKTNYMGVNELNAEIKRLRIKVENLEKEIKVLKEQNK